MHVGLAASITDRIHAGIDDALSTDLDGLDDRALCEATAEVHRAEARLAAVRSRLVAALDRRGAYAPTGAQSAAAYLASACRLPAGVARRHVITARALAHLPATAERLADGDLNGWHASRLAAGWSNPRTQEVAERDDETLSSEAARLPFRHFEQVVAYWRQLADEDGADDEAEAQRARRRLHVSRTLDGCFKLDGLLDPVDGTVVAAALRRIDDGLWEADRDEARRRLGRPPIEGDLERSAQQRRADALVELAKLATSAPADGHRPRPLVSVLCGYETFAGRVCELADGTVLAPGRVAALLDEAVIERAVFDGPARVLEIGQQRCFVRALRRAIELRDRTCTHAHCDRPADACHVDHIEPWDAGGATIQGNGRLLCPFHNHLRQRVRSGPSP
jgi:hypothetical protein